MNKKPKSNREARLYSIPVVVYRSSDEDDNKVIEGYACKFDVLSRNLGWGFREKISPDAFNDVDLSSMDVMCLRDHMKNHLLGRTTSGTVTLEVDEVGLKYRCQIPNTTSGNDTYELVNRGDIPYSSFAFTVESDSWEEDKELGEIRTINKFKMIYDVSPVSDPAYFQTEVDVAKRSYDDYKKPASDELAIELELRDRELQLLKQY